MRDQGKILEEIYVLVFSYDIEDQGNDIKRKDGRHCGMLNAPRSLLRHRRLRLLVSGLTRLLQDSKQRQHEWKTFPSSLNFPQPKPKLPPKVPTPKPQRKRSFRSRYSMPNTSTQGNPVNNHSSPRATPLTQYHAHATRTSSKPGTTSSEDALDTPSTDT